MKKSIKQLDSYKPGKPLQELEREYGIQEGIKLASNENPLGPSPKALSVVRGMLDTLHRYPDANGFCLKQRLSQKLGVSADAIVLGNGSDEIMQLITQAFLLPGEEVIMGDPAFTFYHIVVATAGGKVVKVPLKNFSYDLPAMIDRITPRTKLIFINNPLNPTGAIVREKELEQFLAHVPSGVIVVMDEAYAEYVVDPSFPHSITYLGTEPPIIILRTFSKIYGLAGLRIGYGISDPQLTVYLNKIRGPFNTNTLAQAAALAALDDEAHLENSVRNNREGLAYLYRELEKLGIDYLPTQANFFLIKIGNTAQRVYDLLLREGIIVRTMSEYGLGDYIRVSVGLPVENERFIEALRKALAQR